MALALVAALAAEAPEFGADPAVAEIEQRLDAVVEALHEGAYGQVDELIEQAARLAPRDPGVGFFRAYALAWLGIHDLRSLMADGSFVALLDGVLQQDETAGDEMQNGRLAYYQGLAGLLRARARFGEHERDLLKAAADARRGVKALERAIGRGYESPDASFWLGSYHVLASSLPPVVRALRVLLGLPSGNLEQGIDELRLSAKQGRRFRAEAGLVLADVLARRREGGYAQAMALLRDIPAGVVWRGSLLPIYAGELLAGWGLTPQALSVWQRVLERRQACPACYSAPELARVRMGMARVLFEELRWAEAIPVLEPVMSAPGDWPQGLREQAVLLLARCRARMGEREAIQAILSSFSGSQRTRRRIARLLEEPLPDPHSEAELGAILRRWSTEGAASVRPSLDEFLGRHPGHAGGLLHAGRAAFAVNDAAAAEIRFHAVLELDGDIRAPADGRGWAHLYLGWLADLAGRRQEALRQYRLAQRVDRFDARRAADLFAEIPYGELRTREAGIEILWASPSPGP